MTADSAVSGSEPDEAETKATGGAVAAEADGSIEAAETDRRLPI